ncbi:fasciclin domain-containing protein [Streptomyces formicae]|uniref:FAS1 domain-containing protein n=1 Tax=Streptomyces formicae TaxID=1616117 RepID=A0A291QCC9_9ACTN|nr:fasciclin domain-containing protein [Streptomyces formicae]ATL29166.1 hypothetical protein KY5_4148 [Streptomyces formicae]
MKASPRRTAVLALSLLFALPAVAGCAGSTAQFPGSAVEGPRRDDKAFGAQCPEAVRNASGMRALDAVGRMPRLSRFAALVDRAGAADMFASMQNVTVFVPTNEAFGKLPADRREELTEPKGAGDAVRSLVVAQDLTKDDLAAGRAYPTLQEGVEVRTAAADGGATVGGARVVCGSVTTKDARLHLLDALPARRG